MAEWTRQEKKAPAFAASVLTVSLLVLLLSAISMPFIAYADEPQGDVPITLPDTGDADASSTSLTVESTTWVRLSGDTALDTMVRIVDTGFSGTGGTVIVTTENGYWDALTASGLAGLDDAPVLMTASNVLSDQTSSELSRLAPARVVICGGDAAVSADVVNAIKKQLPNADVARLSGDNAEGTARAIYASRHDWSTTAFIATVNSFQDALSIAPYAYAHHCPIFLTQADGTLSAETLSAIKAGGIENVYIVGGAAAVSATTENQIASADGIMTYKERLWGATAIETSERICEWELSQGMTADGMAVATSSSYYDALSGASLCGQRNSILALVSWSNRTTITGVIADNRGSISTGYLLGGYAAISPDVTEHVKTGVASGSFIGAAAANYCLSKVGISTYTQDNSLRWDSSRNYFDCSALAYRCYLETSDLTGFDILSATDGILYMSASEGEWIVNSGKQVAYNDLQPGDWIFYGGSDNDRYKGIYHVAIYVGDGQQVEAVDYNKGVKLNPLRASSINLYGRPSK